MNIIQIGCYNGQDDVRAYIIENYNCIDKAILIDGNKKYVEECKLAYNNLPQVEVLHYAVVADSRNTVNFYISERAPEECTTSKAYMDSSVYKDTYTVTEVPAINLNTLFRQYNLNRIDRLYIDAEGMDIDIVNSIDFNTFEIPYLCFEHLHSEGIRLNGTDNWPGPGSKYEQCTKKLIDLRYQIQIVGWNIVATK